MTESQKKHKCISYVCIDIQVICISIHGYSIVCIDSISIVIWACVG